MFFIFWLILSILVGVFAANRGHSGLGFFILSLVISPLLSFLIEIVRSPNVKTTEASQVASGEMKKCPACAELVRREAIKCKHCGDTLTVSLASDESIVVPAALINGVYTPSHKRDKKLIGRENG